MLLIRFSNDYEKLPERSNGKSATLLLVKRIMLEYQTKHFLQYDTKIRNGYGGNFVLPEKGDYLFLVFQADGAVFTTLRSYSKIKYEYYSSNIGEIFRIAIN